MPFEKKIILPEYQSLPCDSSMAVHTWVYLNQTTGLLDYAVASDREKSAIGIVFSKPTSTDAIVLRIGVVKNYGTFTLADKLYLSETEPGKHQSNRPDLTNKGNVLQRFAYPINATDIHVDIYKWGVFII